MTNFEILTLVAILVGPIAAVWVGHHLQDRRETKLRQREILKGLMIGRIDITSGDFLRAINIIEIDFNDDEKIMKSFREFMRVINNNQSSEFPRVFTDLYIRIAESIGLKFDQLDIMQGGYLPGGAAERAALQMETLKFIDALSKGEKVVPVFVVPPANEQPPQLQTTALPDEQPNPAKQG
ncbi:DUF6680 family protein [Gimibacter soli]|uniref:DUF6680 domain-containing protein n=1 Tax=Gimibacter soli TaxID=3024400 RepID=A0AAF0BMV1_9PROT|nr:DUF6680 family protein [Gimibacter soli]WCL55036.1 hypothetical protein PH603_04590 [Gimibacter soli]